MSTVSVNESALNDLANSIETAGQEYRSNLARLTNLIQEITSGDIQGDPANDLLARYQEKEDTFKRLAQTIEEAEGYAKQQKAKFQTMMDDLHAGLK